MLINDGTTWSQNTQTAVEGANDFYGQSSALPQTGENEDISAVATLAGATAFYQLNWFSRRKEKKKSLATLTDF